MALPLLLPLLLQQAHGAKPPVTAHVNLTAASTPFPHFWKRCLGSGHALLGTRTDWREHLQRARNELGVSALRMHGVLDDDMSAMAVTDNGTHFYWYNVDVVYDYMLQLGVKPLVELSFMPSVLAACQPCSYVFHNPGSYKGCTCRPKDYEAWYRLVKSLAEHMVQRHGLAEVSQWYWEVWNEMWGLNYTRDYLPLYNASAAALKAVHPSLKVGGPSTALLEHVDDLLKDTAKLGVPLDFVSTHHYPSDGCLSHPPGADPDCFVRDLKESAALAKAAGKPFFITEFKDGLQGGPGYGHGGPHGDSSYAAAFLVRILPQLAGAVDILSWWTFTDIFEENWLKGLPFYGGYGLLTTHGVAKPAYRALQLLAGAGPARLPVLIDDPAPDYANTSTVSVLATVDPDHGVQSLQLFAANFGPEVGANPWPWKPVARNVTVTLPGLKSSRAFLARVDDESTAPYRAWQNMGSPQYLTDAQLSALHAASEVKTSEVRLVDGQLSFEMPPYSVVHARFDTPEGTATLV